MFTRISQLSSPSVLSQCICLNWLALRNSLHVAHTGVCEKVNPFVQALALQSSSRSCSLAPDLVLREPIFQMAVFSGGVFFSQTPLCFISVLGCRHRVASRIRAVWTRELNSVRIGYLSNGAWGGSRMQTAPPSPSKKLGFISCPDSEPALLFWRGWIPVVFLVHSPSSILSSRDHWPAKGEPRKGNALKVAFKSLKSDLKVT